MTRGGDPGGVAISLARDGERRAGDWPGTHRSGKPLGDRRLARRESDTQAGEAVEFSEGTQYDKAGCVGRADDAALGARIGEGLVDHEQAAAPGKTPRRRGKLGRRTAASV